WESTRERGAPTVATFQTLSPAMRNGNFSELSKPILDPSTGLQFPGNLIPADRFSKPAVNFLEKYTPLPNLPGRLFSGFQNGTFNRDQYIGRGDHEFSSKDRMFVRFLWNEDSSLINRGSFTDWYQDQNFRRQSITGNETHTFSPTLLNSFTFTF